MTRWEPSATVRLLFIHHGKYSSDVTVVLFILLVSKKNCYSLPCLVPVSFQALRLLPSEGTQQEMSTGRWSSVSQSPRMWRTVCRLTLLTRRPITPPPPKASETRLKVRDYDDMSVIQCNFIHILFRHCFSIFFVFFMLFRQATAPPRGTMTPWWGASTTWPICSWMGQEDRLTSRPMTPSSSCSTPTPTLFLMNG